MVELWSAVHGRVEAEAEVALWIHEGEIARGERAAGAVISRGTSENNERKRTHGGKPEKHGRFGATGSRSWRSLVRNALLLARGDVLRAW